eukprot:3000152-Rhodomonas_salina.4
MNFQQIKLKGAVKWAELHKGDTSDITGNMKTEKAAMVTTGQGPRIARMPVVLTMKGCLKKLGSFTPTKVVELVGTVAVDVEEADTATHSVDEKGALL